MVQSVLVIKRCLLIVVLFVARSCKLWLQNSFWIMSFVYAYSWEFLHCCKILEGHNRIISMLDMRYIENQVEWCMKLIPQLTHSLFITPWYCFHATIHVTIMPCVWGVFLLTHVAINTMPYFCLKSILKDFFLACWYFGIEQETSPYLSPRWVDF